jgi:hypothetical protein
MKVEKPVVGRRFAVCPDISLLGESDIVRDGMWRIREGVGLDVIQVYRS